MRTNRLQQADVGAEEQQGFALDALVVGGDVVGDGAVAVLEEVAPGDGDGDAEVRRLTDYRSRLPIRSGYAVV